MYFIYKTNYSFDFALYDKQVQKLGNFFIHDSGYYGNKICVFGKYMAILAIILAWIRVYTLNNLNVNKKIIYNFTIGFNITCILLSLLMNVNAFVYIIPLLFSEFYILNQINIEN
jgi:hypothetical protein